MYAWLEHADSATGLLPRTLTGETRDLWNAKDCAADLYPFLVLTASFTDPELYRGRMVELLLTETALTSRVDRLPDDYSFSKHGFARDTVDLPSVLFGASEYVKDGLMPITEWLGDTPWRLRMLGLLDDMWRHAPVATRWGPIVSEDPEVDGEQLQVLSRVYWLTRDPKYLEYAERLGDYFLLGDHHPTRDLATLRLRDHGDEVISGLTELYARLLHGVPAGWNGGVPGCRAPGALRARRALPRLRLRVALGRRGRGRGGCGASRTRRRTPAGSRTAAAASWRGGTGTGTSTGPR